MKNNIQYFVLMLLIFLIGPTPLQMHAVSKIQPGIIILLNGTSSAGKTTLVNALHDIYDTYHVAGIDDYSRTHQSVWWEKMCINFYKKIKDKALNGENILVDTIKYHNNLAKYDALLNQPTKLIKILVYCPLDCILRHVQQRNQNQNALEHRNINQAFLSFLGLYTMQNSKSTPIIDTMHSSKMKAALQQALDAIAHKSEKYIKRQIKTNKKLTDQFNLNTSHDIKLTPQHTWDLIVDTSLDTPENIARKIADFIESKR